MTMTDTPSTDLPPTGKLWTFGNADAGEITVDVPADTCRPPVTFTFPATDGRDAVEVEVGYDAAVDLYEQFGNVLGYLGMCGLTTAEER